jgi:prophage regulatory protein
MNTGETDRILSIKTVCELTSLSRATVWRESQAGRFPCPVQLTPGRVGWLATSVSTWIEDRVRGASKEVPHEH